MSATWTRRQPNNQPDVRRGAAIAFDPISESVILFGGIGSAGMLGDTWRWHGGNWQRIAGAELSSPPPRAFTTLAEDPSRKELVLFGGTSATGSVLADTWVWHGQAWEHKAPQQSPPGRSAASAAPDLVNNGLLLFGGEAGERVPHFLNDTWLWMQGNWTHVTSTGPSARTAASVAAVTSHRLVYLFGGANGLFLSDLWSWDGRRWSNESSRGEAPTGRHATSTAFMESSDAIVVFGGFVADRGQSTNETWLLRGTSWRRDQSAIEPPASAWGAMAYDPSTKELVLLTDRAGKEFRSSETWTRAF